MTGSKLGLMAGLGLFAAVLLGALGLLLGGRISGGATRGRRHHEGPPQPGQVPASRHSSGSTAAR